MPGKIFISCGQASVEEQRFCTRIGRWLTSRGFRPYFAIETQNINDVNSEIIENLRSSDFYVFIDFKRERLGRSKSFRGSVFTNQELAIAYLLGFEKTIFLQQEGIKLEGIGKYILSNAIRFNTIENAAQILQQEITRRVSSGLWSPNYSRHLIPVEVFRSPHAIYQDHTGRREQAWWLVRIQNRRTDQAAINTAAHLVKFVSPHRNEVDSPDRTNLKWAGQTKYEHCIWPSSNESFDAFAIDSNRPTDVFLHSAYDAQRSPIICGTIGNFVLRYTVFCIGFPPLEFGLELDITGDLSTTNVTLLNQ